MYFSQLAKEKTRFSSSSLPSLHLLFAIKTIERWSLASSYFLCCCVIHCFSLFMFEQNSSLSSIFFPSSLSRSSSKLIQNSCIIRFHQLSTSMLLFSRYRSGTAIQRVFVCFSGPFLQVSLRGLMSVFIPLCLLYIQQIKWTKKPKQCLSRTILCQYALGLWQFQFFWTGTNSLFYF